jgi:hypothetical protein
MTKTQIILGIIAYVVHWLLNNVPQLVALKSKLATLEDNISAKIEDEVDQNVVHPVTTAVQMARADIALLRGEVFASKQPPVVAEQTAKDPAVPTTTK